MKKGRKLSGRNSIKVHVIFGSSLLVILGIFAAIYIENANFVKSTRKITVSSQREQSSKDELLISTAARPETSAKWTLTFQEENESGEIVENTYQAGIYDTTVTNNSEYQLESYKVKYIAPCDMYLNNCWNGYVEIHQDVKGRNIVQIVDYKNVNVDNMALDHIYDGTVLLVALYAGDYFYYYPNETSGEVPIRAGSKSEPGGSSTFGFITYHLYGMEVSDNLLGNSEVEYNLVKVLTNRPIFWIMVAISIVWASMVVTSIIYNLRMIHLEEENERDRETIEQTMNAFVSFIDAKDPNTSGHSLRVAQYSMAIARQMGYSSDESTRIYYIGLMHDCGKIAVPDAVLNKKGKLTDEEYTLIKQHTIKGAEILGNFTAIPGMREGVLYHHERFDGAGYPEGLVGEAIPEVARIICVADSFDAMNSVRCYRGRLSRDQILDELVVNKGKQFDARIVDVFLELIKKGTVKIDSE